MFFAITAFVVSAIQIAIGVGIGISVTKHRRQQRAYGLSVLESPAREKAANPCTERPLPAKTQRPAPLLDGGLCLPLDAVEIQSDHSEVTDALEEAGAPSAAASILCGPPAEGAAVSTSPAGGQISVAVPSGPERRTSTRRPFTFRQFVAPYHGGALPCKASFREVECQDISSTGFSFLSTQLPDFDSLVVALGVPPHQTYLQAHIVNRFSVDDGVAPLYRIGCRFAAQVTTW
ncbi:MAG TPA: hypothetical protein VNH11_03745 [Pirellulales bacterium]|nr:hypothetical protein [Pirellulales bacterium]